MSRLVFLICGILVGAIAAIVIFTYLGAIQLGKSQTEQSLEAQIESIPIETICESIASGNQILGEDRVTVWSDGKRYRVVGWRVEQSGVPVFYWTGADLPADVAGCKQEPQASRP